MESAATSLRRELRALTGLRGVAATWVVLLHLMTMVDDLVPEVSTGFEFASRSGFLGVDIFFVLSGYVLSYTYASASGAGHVSFLRRRLSRIYPLHLTILVLLFGAVRVLGIEPWQSTGEGRWTTQALVESVLLIQSWTGNDAVWNAVSWSISCEWFVYLTFPVFVALGRAIDRGLSATLQRTMILLLLVAPFGVASLPTFAGRLLLQVVPLFAAGVLLELRSRHGDTLRGTASRPGIVFLLLVVTSSVLATTPGRAYLAVPLVAPLILGLARGESRFAQLLSTSTARYLGRLSFALYMTHYLAIWAIRYFVSASTLRAMSPIVGGLAIAGLLVGLIAIAATAHHLIEEPARRFLNRGTGRA